MKILALLVLSYSIFTATDSLANNDQQIQSGSDLIYKSGFELLPPSDSILAGYFVEWGVYARNYHVKNMHTSGSAEKLTHIIYSFGNVTNGECVMGDNYAATDKYYDANSSVDGTSDSWDTGFFRTTLSCPQFSPAFSGLASKRFPLPETE